MRLPWGFACKTSGAKPRVEVEVVLRAQGIRLRALDAGARLEFRVLCVAFGLKQGSGVSCSCSSPGRGLVLERTSTISRHLLHGQHVSDLTTTNP